MFKTVSFIFFATIAVALAKPGVLAPVAYSAPLVAAPVAPAVVTATSSQVVARNYNGIAAPLVAAAPVAYTAPAFAAPLAYTAPVAKYVAAPAFAAPAVAAPAFAAPLKYTAAAPFYF